MRQWLAAVLVAGLCAAPVLRVVCEVTCASTDTEHAAAAIPSCHETSPVSAQVNLEAPDDCRDHAQFLTVVSVQKSAGAKIDTGSNFVETTPGLDLQFVRVARAHARGSTSPPIPPGTRILRV